MLVSRTKLPRSTIGEEIRNENVAPRGSPALVKPMKRGMDEQEQNGVTVPSNAAMAFAHRPWKCPSILRLLSGGNQLWMYEMTKIRTQSKIVILVTS